MSSLSEVIDQLREADRLARECEALSQQLADKASLMRAIYARVQGEMRSDSLIQSYSFANAIVNKAIGCRLSAGWVIELTRQVIQRLAE